MIRTESARAESSLDTCTLVSRGLAGRLSLLCSGCFSSLSHFLSISLSFSLCFPLSVSLRPLCDFLVSQTLPDSREVLPIIAWLRSSAGSLLFSMVSVLPSSAAPQSQAPSGGAAAAGLPQQQQQPPPQQQRQQQHQPAGAAAAAFLSAAAGPPQPSVEYVLNQRWIRTNPARAGVITIDKEAFIDYAQRNSNENRLSTCLTTAVASINAFATSPAFLSLLISVSHSLADAFGVRCLAAFERSMMNQGQQLETALWNVVGNIDISLIPHHSRNSFIMESDVVAGALLCNRGVIPHYKTAQSPIFNIRPSLPHEPSLLVDVVQLMRSLIAWDAANQAVPDLFQVLVTIKLLHETYHHIMSPLTELVRRIAGSQAAPIPSVSFTRSSTVSCAIAETVA